VSAIVVQTVDYGEADRIVHAVTARGRVAWFAHAAKKSRRRFGGALEPFTTIEPELEVKRRQGMAVISAASTVRARLGIRSRLESLALASYAAELTVKIAPEESDTTGLFALLSTLLDEVDQRAGTRPLWRAFELAALTELGITPELQSCVSCGRRLKDDEDSALDLEAGGAFCPEHAEGRRRIGPKTRAWAQGALAQGGRTFDDAAGLDPTWADPAAERLGKHLDVVLEAHVGRLRSLTWLREIML
jgi:DNA repair protein RecO (recombination protein O)